MTNLYVHSKMPDDERRERLYSGDIFVHAASDASLALCALARKILEEAFSPHAPETAQNHLLVEEYAAILSELKPAFIHHSECKILLPQLLADVGCNPDETYFDVPRLRTSTSDGYLTTGIAYAFHPHRDTWYSAPHCQINWWMPVFEFSADNGMEFYPRYFSEPVKNGSNTYNYYRWNRDSRGQAANQIGKDTRVQPRPEEPMDLADRLRLVPAVGEMIVFSGAQMHASVPNDTGRTRISIDFRTVHLNDVRQRRGAPNVDSACTGTSLRDFLNCRDMNRLPEELVAPYDTEDIPDGAPTIFDPGISDSSPSQTS